MGLLLTHTACCGNSIVCSSLQPVCGPYTLPAALARVLDSRFACKRDVHRWTESVAAGPWSIGCVTAISEPHNKTAFFTCHITYFAISEVITVIHLPKEPLSFHSHKSLGWVNFPLEFSWPAFLPDCGAVVGKQTAVIKCMGIQWPLKSAMCITKRQVHPPWQTCFPRLSTLDSTPPFCTTDCGAT